MFGRVFPFLLDQFCVNRFKAIIFDFNGTVFHDTRVVFSWYNEIFRRYGLREVSDEMFRRYYGPPYETFLMNVGVPKAIVENVENDIIHSLHSVYEPMAAQAPLRLGVRPVLGAIRASGMEMAILSNHVKSSIRTHLFRLGAETFFKASEILANGGYKEQVEGRKKGERLLRFWEKRGLKPEETVIVGDTPEEIEIGKTYGMATIGLTGGCASAARLKEADAVIPSWLHLPKLLWKPRVRSLSKDMRL